MAITRTSGRVVALFAFLSLAIFVMETDAQCMYYDEVCKYKGKTYPMFDTWHTDDCEWCMCEGEYGYMCCSKFSIPIDYDNGCEVTRDYSTCQTKVVDEDGKDCEVLVGVL
ncbi:prostate-associated microseminoprotein-like [Asterias amurensis]|uniref:prostate-associated microseminoprotein-like n=1 Tax=Asterias amurensis TaxID=7602 RepID=UPI003AB29636